MAYNIVQSSPIVRGVNSITFSVSSALTVGNVVLLEILSEGASPNAIPGFALQAADTQGNTSSASRWARTIKSGDPQILTVNLNSPSVGFGLELSGYTALGGG